MKFGERSGELKIGHGKPNENFIIEKGTKDRFGNQYLTSKEFSYLDNSGQKISAGILISTAGQKFIAEHPKILHNLDRGLEYLEESPNLEKIHNDVIDLGQGVFLQHITYGIQSFFYVLTIGNEKYAIKTHYNWKGEKNQPYINEMLQTQAIARDLEVELKELKIELSNFLFTSGQVSCTQYEEEENNYSNFTIPRLTKFFSLISKYIKTKQQQNDPLWKNVVVDSKGNLEDIARNFRTKKDGTIVCIDPLIILQK